MRVSVVPIFASAVMTILWPRCMAFSPTTSNGKGKSVPFQQSAQDASQPNEISSSRRNFVTQGITSLLTFGVITETACAAESSNTVFADKKFSVQDAKQRFQAARKDLKYLVDHYAEISKGGGDAVRNYLGTQGVNSNLYGIQKILKILQDEAVDIVDYTEAMDEFNAYYYQAEGAAYQSMFVEFSSAKGTPEAFLKTAKQDLDQLEKYMDLLAAQLGN